MLDVLEDEGLQLGEVLGVFGVYDGQGSLRAGWLTLCVYSQEAIVFSAFEVSKSEVVGPESVLSGVPNGLHPDKLEPFLDLDKRRVHLYEELCHLKGLERLESIDTILVIINKSHVYRREYVY